MAFEGLTEKLNNVFKKLRGKGRLTEEDVDIALKEVKMALLEADVNFKVVKDFVKSIKEKTVGTDILSGLNPAQSVIKTVNDEMTLLMGETASEIAFEPGKATTVIMLAGLQGAGKTTAAAKLAKAFVKKGKKSLLAALDVYRPAAIEQLKINGQKTDTEVFSIDGEKDVCKIAKSAYEYAINNNFNVLILDTAGRLSIDEEMMDELKRIKDTIVVHQTILAVDAMTGQEAVNVAKSFNEQIEINGVILTKMDGDARGGAALSVRAVTGKPILYVSEGEKLDALDVFYPDRMASRILGMGDILSAIEKAQANIEIDEEKSKEMSDHLRKGKFDFDDYLESMRQMKKMGGLSSLMGMMPGMGIKASDFDSDETEKQMKRTEAIVLSMTKEERKDPKIINPRRKIRIAKGAGVDIAEVNRFLKQFEQMSKMMKQFSKPGKRRGFGLPGMGGMGKFPF